MNKAPGEFRLSPAEEIRGLPKGELHVHLNGHFSSQLVREILLEEQTTLPPGFDLQQDLTRSVPCATLSQYLKPWQVLHLIHSAVTSRSWRAS